jgi:hypothetical protein
MHWTCASCGWVNDPVSDKNRAVRGDRCENCKTPKGKVRNVSWDELPSRLIVNYPTSKHQRGERHGTNVRTNADGTAWG